ncbi:sterol desaturase family protein [Sphingomonas sp. 28-63-12]|uniref:sterol desaturase family protein n=1 Tax=Sphingomonas sp. 28-63-12 TaxID=1970434 RepID=UPI000BCA9991|nr:MAG: hypothetical protein B7Y47_15440 [Sphingomonas sp. 28-63-12]
MIAPKSLIDVIVDDVRFYLPYELGRYFIAAGVLAAILWLLKRTRLKSRQIQPRTASLADFRREVAASLLTIFIYLLVAIPIDWSEHNGLLVYGGDTHPLAYSLMMFGLIVLGHDAYFYWTHRAMHTRLLFRTFHLHHHRSTTPTPWTAYSFAAPEAVVNALFFPLWLIFVPTPGIVTFSFLTVQIIRNVIAHAGLELHPRWWLSTPLTSWISATTHHDLHHSGSFGHNYGFWFTFWDRMMGTEHPLYRETFARVTARDATTGSPTTESQRLLTRTSGL